MTGATDTVLSRGRLVIENGSVRRARGRRVVPETRDPQLIRAPITADTVVVSVSVSNGASRPQHRVVLPEGERAAALHIDDGVIERIVEYDSDDPTGASVFDVGDLRRLAGPRRHARARQRAGPHRVGRLRHRDARGGGRRRHDARRHAAQQHPGDDDRRRRSTRSATRRAAQCHVDVGFWGGVVPGNAGELERARRRRRARVQVLPRAVGRRRVSARSTKPTCAWRCRSSRGAACRCSCTPSSRSDRRATLADPADPQPLSPTLPRDAAAARPKLDAIRLMIRLADEFEARVAHRPPLVGGRRRGDRRARSADGVPITAETCPHYLTFAAEEIPDGATRVQVRAADPRGAHREALWDGARERRARSGRDRSLAVAAGAEDARRLRRARGAASRRSSCRCAAVWTGARAQRGLQRSSAIVARWMSAAPARSPGLSDRKGAHRRRAATPTWSSGIRTPSSSSMPAALQQRHKLTPYAGRPLRGVVHTTFVRGAARVGRRTRSRRAYGGRLL